MLALVAQVQALRLWVVDGKMGFVVYRPDMDAC